MKFLLATLIAGLLSVEAAALESKPLPDGVTLKGSNDIAEAWLTRPTPRYGHAILGDAIEAGGLAVRMTDGQVHELVLPADYVFEDRRARPVDLDGDGRDEVVVVLSSLDQGAALAVYGVVGGKLALRAKTAHIGRPNRWLNPAEFADLDGDGRIEITAVWTPHLGRVLQAWRYADGKLDKVAEVAGYSNHAIGSPVQDLTEIVKLSDGRTALAIPTPGYDKIAFMVLEDGAFAEVSAEAGIASLARSRGAALADFDLDGRLDLVVVNRRAPLELWLNRSTGTGNWATVDLRQDRANRLAIGAWLEIDRGDAAEWRERTIGGGHVSGTLLPFHIGLGAADAIRVRVWWPDGDASGWQEISAGARVTLTR